jgi:hypothetical protein
MAKRWSRVEDRRAASRFEAQDYQAPDARRLTPAEVRAAVGVETFEQNLVQPEQAQADALAKKTRSARTAAPASRAEDVKMEQGLPSEEELLRQADIEAQRLRELQDQEERAQAFRRAKHIEAEEAQSRMAENGHRAETQNGDISSASSRYAIALGENYNVRDPYASLARAAMAEYAMFHRNHEKLRAEEAKEPDPDKRRVIELRRKIEACDFGALGRERLAVITDYLTGSKDAPQAKIDRAWAADARARAAELRTERAQLIEAIQHRVEVTVDAAGAAQKPEATRAREEPQPPKSSPNRTPAGEEATNHPGTATASPRAEIRPAEVIETKEAASIPPAPAPSPQPVGLADNVGASSVQDAIESPPSLLVTVSPTLSRADVIASPPASQVTMPKTAPEVPRETAPPSPPEQLEMPWMESLRRRVEESLPSPGDNASEQTIARLAKRLQQARNPPEVANDQARDDPGPGLDI